MSTQSFKNRHVPPRVLHARSRGQSIPLIALMIVVLVGMVGLSVDVGNTYNETRHVERAANAAAIAGMQVYLETEGSTDRDRLVYQAIENTFKENNVNLLPDGADPQPGMFSFTATYLDSAGTPQGTVGNSKIPDAAYIRINTTGKVDTYFARALGQDTLPVNSLTFAGRCPPVNGVFPMGVKHNLIDPNARDPMTGEIRPEFKEPDGYATLPDILNPLEREYSFKRLYTGIHNLSHGDTTFGFLKWKTGQSEDDLANMMAGDGTLKYGFEEVHEWPEESTDAPQGYPTEPGYLTYGDWVHGFPSDPLGSNLMANVEAQFDFHIRNRSKMILPLYRLGMLEPGFDDRGVFHVNQFGEFYLLDYDRVNGKWIDVVFLRYSPLIPCPAENVQPPPTYGVKGPVEITPRWGEVPEEGKPAGYAIMLDVSGSMTWNFLGWGSKDGRDYQCEAYDPDYPDITYTFADGGVGNCTNARAWWRERTDRRAYASREAIVDIIDRMEAEDRIRVVAFSNYIEKTSPEWYSTDSDIVEHVRTIGEYNPGGYESPTYLTNGGTCGAAAINKAWQFLAASDFPDGLRKVAIYMTDGVSNKKFTGSDSCGTPPTKPECSHLGSNERVNTAFCQIGSVGGQELPITQMQTISKMMHEDLGDDFMFYVLAMGRLDTTGLDRVSTHPDMLFAARQAEQVEQLLDEIRLQVSYGECVPRTGDEVDHIDADKAPDRGLLPPDMPPNAFGYVYVTKDGDTKKIPIIHDGSGKLVYYLEEGLEPGTYTLTAWVMYNASGKDGGTWQYDVLIDTYTSTSVPSLTFNVSEPSTLGSIADGPLVRLDSRASAEALCD